MSRFKQEGRRDERASVGVIAEDEWPKVGASSAAGTAASKSASKVSQSAAIIPVSQSPAAPLSIARSPSSPWKISASPQSIVSSSKLSADARSFSASNSSSSTTTSNGGTAKMASPSAIALPTTTTSVATRTTAAATTTAKQRQPSVPQQSPIVLLSRNNDCNSSNRTSCTTTAAAKSNFSRQPAQSAAPTTRATNPHKQKKQFPKLKQPVESRAIPIPIPKQVHKALASAPTTTSATSKDAKPSQQPPTPKQTQASPNLQQKQQKQQQQQQQKAANAAFSKLLQPKRDVAAAMDAHHSAAMLGFFTVATTPSSPQPPHVNGVTANPAHNQKGEATTMATTHAMLTFNGQTFMGGNAAAVLTGTKGRQRVRPRMKKFSALKKKVLEERLRKWKELHPPDNDNANSNDLDTAASTNDDALTNKGNVRQTSTVCLLGFCTQDEIEDDDEYEEILANLHDMATKVSDGQEPLYIYIPRSGVVHSATNSSMLWPAWVQFDHQSLPSATTSDKRVEAAVASWNGLVLGGQELQCRPVVLPAPEALSTLSGAGIDNSIDDTTTGANQVSATVDTDDEAQWRAQCLASLLEPTNNKGGQPATTTSKEPIQSSFAIIVQNAITQDDLDDEDCMAESMNDLRELLSKYGSIEALDVVESIDETSPPRLRVLFSGGGGGEASYDPNKVVTELNLISIGGQQLVAHLDSVKLDAATNGDCHVRLQNVLTADDLDDADCLEESLNDLRELAQRFGQVDKVIVEEEDNMQASNASEYAIRIYYASLKEAQAAVQGFDGTVIGGSAVSASLAGIPTTSDALSASSESPPASASTDTRMLSGDKIISERFAECKRVPKIANQDATRPYATLAPATMTNADGKGTIKTLLVEMLGELMRLQKRAVDDKNAKARRRLVMGLREVARGIRAHKVKMVVMANNLDEYGVIDETLQEIIDLCKTEDVPVFYEFTKRALGKALGKTIKVAVAGIQNADGAHQQFKALMKYAAKI